MDAILSPEATSPKMATTTTSSITDTTNKNGQDPPPRFIIRLPKPASSMSSSSSASSLSPECSHATLPIANSSSSAKEGPKVTTTLPVVSASETGLPADSSVLAPVLTAVALPPAIPHSPLPLATANYCCISISDCAPNETAHLPKKEIGNDMARAAVELRPPVANPKAAAAADGPWLSSITYEPFQLLFNHKSSMVNAKMNVIIDAKCFCAESNAALRKRAFWGGQDGLYTDDSDLVCILKHQNMLPPDGQSLKVSIKICPRLATYASIDQNGIKSRSWTHAPHHGLSIKILSLTPYSLNAKRKCHPPCHLHSTDGSIVKFSSRDGSALCDINNLIFQGATATVLSNLEKLQLEGDTHTYTFTRNPSPHDDEHKDNPTITMTSHGHAQGRKQSIRQIFSDLHSDELYWLVGGLKVRNTFFHLRGYRWLS